MRARCQGWMDRVNFPARHRMEFPAHHSQAFTPMPYRIIFPVSEQPQKRARQSRLHRRSRVTPPAPANPSAAPRKCGACGLLRGKMTRKCFTTSRTFIWSSIRGNGRSSIRGARRVKLIGPSCRRKFLLHQRPLQVKNRRFEWSQALHQCQPMRCFLSRAVKIHLSTGRAADELE